MDERLFPGQGPRCYTKRTIYQCKHEQVAFLLPIPQTEEGVGLVRLIGRAPAGGEGHYHQIVAPAPE